MASFVELEWIGLDDSLEGGGARRAHVTSADALSVARRGDGRRVAYLLEWKYAESSRSGVSPAIARRRALYSALFAAEDSSMNGAAALDDVLYDPLYQLQLVRLALLGDRMVRRRELGVKEARVVVVCPEENHAYREAAPSPALTDKRHRRARRAARPLPTALEGSLRDPLDVARGAARCRGSGVRRYAGAGPLARLRSRPLRLIAAKSAA